MQPFWLAVSFHKSMRPMRSKISMSWSLPSIVLNMGFMPLRTTTPRLEAANAGSVFVAEPSLPGNRWQVCVSSDACSGSSRSDSMAISSIW